MALLQSIGRGLRSARAALWNGSPKPASCEQQPELENLQIGGPPAPPPRATSSSPALPHTSSWEATCMFNTGSSLPEHLGEVFVGGTPITPFTIAKHGITQSMSETETEPPATAARQYALFTSSQQLTTEQIQRMLEENYSFIKAIVDAQNLSRLEAMNQFQDKLQSNLMQLAALADSQPQAPAPATPAPAPAPAAARPVPGALDVARLQLQLLQQQQQAAGTATAGAGAAGQQTPVPTPLPMGMTQPMGTTAPGQPAFPPAPGGQGAPPAQPLPQASLQQHQQQLLLQQAAFLHQQQQQQQQQNNFM